MTNTLYYGDNLEVLRQHVADGSVDLVYLDPPFNSNANYNVLFAEQDGTRAAAQIQAFEDTWRWDEVAAAAYEDVVTRGGKVSDAMQAFHTLLGPSNMLAYLAMMAPRLVELRRVLKATGSLYLHCDPTAGHYLKLILDAVFGTRNFRSEIVWKRSGAHSDSKQGRRCHGHIHDLIFFYTKSDEWTWNDIFSPYEQEYIERDYRLIEEGTGRRFRRDNLTAARPGGDVEYLWRVKRPSGAKERWTADLEDEHLNPRPGWDYRGVPPYKGRFWAYSKANMVQFAKEGRLRHTFEGMPEYKRYLDEMPGVPLQDVWTDISIAGSAERLGYPTQKSEELLDRIVQASSNEGDVVLDPFCGCGTTIASAQRLKRRWIGIDITNLAISLIRSRLRDQYGEAIEQTYCVIGEPGTVQDAKVLAADDPYQFQWWALGLVGARPAEQKKGADKGIDGRIVFFDEKGQKAKTVILSVKAGHVTASHVRDLRGVIEREKAAIGVVISFEEPTKPMRSEAAEAGFYTSPGWGTKHPRVQLLTVGELLDGKTISMPPRRQTDATFKRARKVDSPTETAVGFDFGEMDE